MRIIIDIYEDEQELYEDTYIIVDEAHNITNRKELYDFVNKFKNGLVMSATIPIQFYESVKYSMIYEYNIRKAIDDKLITRFTVHLPQIAEFNLSKAQIDKDVPPQLVNPFDIELLNRASFLMKGMLSYKVSRCITYLNSEKCNRFCQLFSKICEYNGVLLD